MKFNSNKKLAINVTLSILHDLYDAIPQLIKLLTPSGWKDGRLHQEMMAHRQIQYNEFIKNEAAHWKKMSSSPYRPDTSHAAFEEISFDEYFYITFPPLYNDKLELFYILGFLLLDITYVSTLYYPSDPHEYYYFEGLDIEQLILQIAYRDKQIPAENAKVMIAVFPPPYLDDMDLHHCLETVFAIFMKHGLRLDYWDDDLLQIMRLQERYEELFYSNLRHEEKQMRVEKVRTEICSIIADIAKDAVDPLDLPAIIDLFNRRKICPIVLAYLHIYEEFPRGYPYLLDDYEDE
ncbi:hypothetical protein [Sphingobacterium thalpophilum]|uniref:hypothetical protein n=1 Tax=Sphingobacterium thalpophilum TaxID=259 RepID=UPI002D77FAA0|nr:hypothetical protein [Sphingobacterium thalpophilum]